MSRGSSGSESTPSDSHQTTSSIPMVEDIEVEKMIDFASSYFFTKMELMPKNILSFYGFEDKKWLQHFHKEIVEEQEEFAHLIDRINRAAKNRQNKPLTATKQLRIRTSLSINTSKESIHNRDQAIKSQSSPRQMARRSSETHKSNTSHLSHSQSSLLKSEEIKSNNEGSSQSQQSEESRSKPTHIKELNTQKNPHQKIPDQRQVKQSDFRFKSTGSKKVQVQFQQSDHSQVDPQIDLDQFSSYTDSQKPARKFTKLESIQEQSSRLSTIKSGRHGQQKDQARNIKKQASNQSKKNSSVQNMKTVLELQRIQLSIRQLQQKFQALMEYELEFPKHSQRLDQFLPSETKPRLKLGPVIDLNDLQS